MGSRGRFHRNGPIRALDEDARSGHYGRVQLTAAQAVERIAGAGGLVHMRWSHGELGRPGDNLYRVTFVAARPHKLLIELDEQVLAILTEPLLVSASGIAVIIDYEQLTIDRQGYGDMTPHSDAFGRGSFTIYKTGA